MQGKNQGECSWRVEYRYDLYSTRSQRLVIIARVARRSRVPQTHRFVPLGFEAGGAFGRATLDFLREVVEVAGDQSSADLYHWSAMEFGEHWLQRLSLVLARGQADLVLEAVKTARKNHRGRDGGRGASAEWSLTDCQPCVSLV